MRCEHFPDVVHVDLHLKIMLDVVIYHLQQVDERARVVICAVDSSHFVIHTVRLMRDLERGIGAEHIRIAACRRVLAQRVEQLEQTAAAARNRNVFPKICAALLFKPALAAQLADEETGTAGNIAQLILVDVLALEGSLGQLLLETAPQHGIQHVLGQLQLFAVRRVQHIERIRVQRTVR